MVFLILCEPHLAPNQIMIYVVVLRACVDNMVFCWCFSYGRWPIENVVLKWQVNFDNKFIEYDPGDRQWNVCSFSVFQFGLCYFRVIFIHPLCPYVIHYIVFMANKLHTPRSSIVESCEMKLVNCI